MSDEVKEDCRLFVTYSGVKLPSKLVNPIEPDALSNRNTYIRAWYGPGDLLLRFEKIVYGEVELTHVYEYDAAGVLRHAVITVQDEEPMMMDYDETGAPAPV
jgi:hypothetical protein